MGERGKKGAARFERYLGLCNRYLEAINMERLLLINIDILDTQNIAFMQAASEHRNKKTPRLTNRMSRASNRKRTRLEIELKNAQIRSNALARMIISETIVPDELKPINRDRDELVIIFNALSAVKRNMGTFPYTEDQINKLCVTCYEKTKYERSRSNKALNLKTS